MTQIKTFYENLTPSTVTVLNTPIATPIITSISTSTTGGTLPANTTYYYKIVAIDALGGLSLPSNEVSITTGSSGATHTITLNWNTVPGCNRIRIYRGTSSNGQSIYFTNSTSLANTATTYTNTSQVSGSIAGTPPVVNTAYSHLANDSTFMTPGLFVSGNGISFNGIGGTTLLSSRGLQSVDLQLNRTVPTQITSGAYSAILAGTTNTVSGSYSAIIAGSSNNASSSYSTIIAGSSNNASGAYSAILAGSVSTASASFSKAFGAYALANLYGQTAIASGRNSITGDAQDSRLTSRNTTTNTATPTELLLDGNGGTNYFTIANNSTQPFIILASARGTAGTNIAKSAAWEIKGLVVNNSNVISIPSSSITTIHKDISEWDISISVVGTRLAITATGDAGSTIKWFASIWHTMNLA